MNKKGQVIFYGLMLAVVVIIVAMVLAPVIKNHLDGVMGPNTATTQGLDCTNSSIPDFQKGQCVVTDWSQVYFFFGLLAVAGVVIGAKIIIG